LLGGMAEKPMKKERAFWSGSCLLQEETKARRAITRATARAL